MNVEFGILENQKVSEISEANKVFLGTLDKVGNPLGNQKVFPKKFPRCFDFPRIRIFLDCSVLAGEVYDE
jgi:hypothetical protein